MGHHLRIETEQGLFVLRATREQVLADETMDPVDRRVYLAMLDVAERHRQMRQDDAAHEAAAAMAHRKARPKLGKARPR
jgi:hypothetical protein